jgi:hypothetical protein
VSKLAACHHHILAPCVSENSSRNTQVPLASAVCLAFFLLQHAGAACLLLHFALTARALSSTSYLSTSYLSLSPRHTHALSLRQEVRGVCTPALRFLFNDTLESLITPLQLLPLMAIPSHSCPVDIHLSRNRKCRRQRAAALGRATHEPKCLLPGFPYLTHTHPGHGSHASVRAMSHVYVCLSSTCVSRQRVVYVCLSSTCVSDLTLSVVPKK